MPHRPVIRMKVFKEDWFSIYFMIIRNIFLKNFLKETFMHSLFSYVAGFVFF